MKQQWSSCFLTLNYTQLVIHHDTCSLMFERCICYSEVTVCCSTAVAFSQILCNQLLVFLLW